MSGPQPDQSPRAPWQMRRYVVAAIVAAVALVIYLLVAVSTVLAPPADEPPVGIVPGAPTPTSHPTPGPDQPSPPGEEVVPGSDRAFVPPVVPPAPHAGEDDQAASDASDAAAISGVQAWFHYDNLEPASIRQARLEALFTPDSTVPSDQPLLGGPVNQKNTVIESHVDTMKVLEATDTTTTYRVTVRYDVAFWDEESTENWHSSANVLITTRWVDGYWLADDLELLGIGSLIY